MRITITARPVTKKTHNRTCDIGRPCPACRRRERTIVLPSEQFEDFEAAVAPVLQQAWAARDPRREPCARCEGSGKRNRKPCTGCGATGQRAVPLEVPVLVEAIFYRDRAIGDLAGFIQALGDVLEVAGVIRNDRLIVGWPMPRDGGLPLRKDAARPRIELVITPLLEQQRGLFQEQAA